MTKLNTQALFLIMQENGLHNAQSLANAMCRKGWSVTTPGVQNWMDGKRTPRGQYLTALCKTLNCKPKDILIEEKEQ